MSRSVLVKVISSRFSKVQEKYSGGQITPLLLTKELIYRNRELSETLSDLGEE